MATHHYPQPTTGEYSESPQMPIATSGADDARYFDQHSQNDSVAAGVMEEYAEKPPPPPRRRFYKQKKYWIVCGILTAIIVVVVVLLIVFVFFPMIAQTIMNKAGIEVGSADITFSPPNDSNLAKRQEQYNMNETFYMSMTSKLTDTGPFSADIKFHNPINVYYNDTILLGTLTLPDTHVSGGSGELKAVTPFIIKDTNEFSAFAKEMLAKETFVWKMKGKLDITALSRTATVDLEKDIVLNGMNGFPNVTITSFEMPGNAPEGGILVELGTALTSPSPIGVQLGTIAMQIGYEGVVLGQVTSENVTLHEGVNDLKLKGTLIPQNDQANLDKIGQLFSNYVAGKMSTTTAVGVSAAPDGHDPINWLTEGFKSVQLNVGLGLAEPMNIIRGVSMGYLDLAFNKDSPYAPITSAPAVVADYSIPFGFTLDITQVSQDLKLGTNDTGDFASINVPYVPSKSDQAAGKLQFAMNNVAITAMDDKHDAFDGFTYDLTASDGYTFNVGGQASTKTSTPIGNITLSGITFKVPTTLHGLQFLNSTPTTVDAVDVTGGTKEALQLAINVTMDNPSDFSISTGDVTFAFLASDTQLGQVMLSNLKLNRGSNSVTASSTFDPKSSSVGQNLLSTFVMGKNNDVNIAGYDGSTAIQSLAKALGAISITTSLPGLKDPLVQGSKLTVNEDSPKTGIVAVQVSIANPFTAGLSITSVKSSVSYKGMPVGNIDQDISSSPIVIGGHSTVQSNPLDMKMNIEPASVALLLRTLAKESNLDTRALDALLGMGGLHVAGMEDISPDSSLFQGFNISNYVMEAMKSLKADLQLQSGLTIGEYDDVLEFSQNSVAVETDATVTRLIPIVGQPIVQQIVDGAKLGFESIILSSPTDTSFKVNMSGSITNAGPMDAEISFPSPLTIAWEGRVLGTVKMATINSKADVGAQFTVPGDFSVTDQDAMGEFSGYLINNPDFQWNIYTEGVAVNALGYTFTNISMNKFVTLAGANGFKDAVKITKFDLPSNDPAGGITLTASTTINNPSQVGFNLAGAGFSAYFEDVLLGPLASDGPAIFPPRGTANINMKGRMIPQDSQEGLDAVTKVFKNYLNASDSPLTVVGESGSGPNGQVGWLTTGFKTIKIENVILPGPDQKPTLIPSITMGDMQIDFVKSEYEPPAGSTKVLAQLKNPFGFPLGVSSLNMEVTASYEGTDMASLKIPDEKATTSDTGLVTTQFSDVPFSTFDDAHKVFSDFLKATTATGNVTFGLAGISNAVTETAIGSLKLDGIDFDVDTALAGFNNFNGKTEILSMAVTGGTSEYILVKLSIAMTNPSQITITLGDMKLITNMDEFNSAVGDVFLKDVTIKPGNNTMDVEMHMGGDDKKALQQLLSDYMTGATVPLTITGSQDATEIEPLKDALSTIKLATTMTGIKDKLVDSVYVSAGLDALTTHEAKTKITLTNPIGTEFSINSIEAVVYTTLNGNRFQVGHIDYKLPSAFKVPSGEQATSEEMPVTVDADIGQLLELLFNAKDLKFDIYQNASVIVGEGDGFASTLYYYQMQVPATLDFNILGLSLTGADEPDSGTNNSSIADLPASVIDKLPKSVLDQLGYSSKAPEASATSSGSGQEASSSATSSGGGGLLGDLTDKPTPTPEAKESSSSSSEDKSSDDGGDKTASEKPSETGSGDKSDESSSSSSSEDSGDGKPHWLWPFRMA